MLIHKYTVHLSRGPEVGGRKRDRRKEGGLMKRRHFIYFYNKMAWFLYTGQFTPYKQYVYFHTRLQTIYTSIQYPRKVSTGLKFEDEGKVANTQPRYNVLHPRCNLYQENKREITRLVNHGTTDARPSYLLANANTQIYCTDSCTPLQIVKLTVLALVGNSLVQYYFTPEFYSIWFYSWRTDIDGHPESRRCYRDMTSLVCLTAHPPPPANIYIHCNGGCWGGRGTRGEREKEEKTSS